MNETTWVYIQSEPRLWTVGFYDPKGNWHPDSDYATREDAAKRVNYLNGGSPDLLQLCRTARLFALQTKHQDRELLEVLDEVITKVEHPNTDLHRAACSSCMFAHDKNLPDA